MRSGVVEELISASKAGQAYEGLHDLTLRESIMSPLRDGAPHSSAPVPSSSGERLPDVAS